MIVIKTLPDPIFVTAPDFQTVVDGIKDAESENHPWMKMEDVAAISLVRPE